MTNWPPNAVLKAIETVRKSRETLRFAQLQLGEDKQALKQAMSDLTSIPMEHLEVRSEWSPCPRSVTGHCYYDYRKSSHDDICEVCGEPSEQK